MASARLGMPPSGKIQIGNTGDTSSTIPGRGGSGREGSERDVMEQTAPDGLSGVEVAVALPWASGWDGRSSQKEGGRGRSEDAKGRSIPLQGQALLSGRPAAMLDLCSCRASLDAGPCADNRKEAQGLGKDGARGSIHIKLLKTTGNKPYSSLCHYPADPRRVRDRYVLRYS